MSSVSPLPLRSLRSAIPDPALWPAPMPGEDTREIVHSLLQRSAEEIDELVRAGVLQPTPSPESDGRLGAQERE